MRLLIVPASRYGGTAEIGRKMARVLRDRGIDIDVSQPQHLQDPSPYDGFIIGSAVYLGDWLVEAREFVDRHRATIEQRPTWLFSSGPLGADAPLDPLRTGVIDGLLTTTGAREHHLFSGRIELSRLGTKDRFLARWVGITDGDHREWDRIESWANDIADQMADHMPEMGDRPDPSVNDASPAINQGA